MASTSSSSVSPKFIIQIVLYVITLTVSSVFSFRSSLPLSTLYRSMNVEEAKALSPPSLTAKENESDMKKKENNINPFLKSSWYATEAFGKIFATPRVENKVIQKSGYGEEIDLRKKPSSLEEALKRIEMDNARSYFLSGSIDIMAYDKDCIFADPFVTFSGKLEILE